MIDKYELRIGNYVWYDDKPSAYCDIITQIRDDEVEIISDSPWAGLSYRTFDQICPIELTESLFPKLGFEYSGYWIKDNIRIYPYGITCLSYHTDSIVENQDSLEITSVHQLQNYFYALTCRELNLKL